MTPGASTAAAPAKRRAVRAWIAGGISCALIVTVAVIANGYDAQETPREEASVWVHRDAGQYARVNTETGEIDTVRRIEEPSGIVQSANRSIALSHGNGRAHPIDAALPVDFGESSANGDDEASVETASTGADDAAENAADDTAVRMPDETRDVLSAGDAIAVRTEEGGVYLADLDEGGPGSGSSDSGEGSAAGAASFSGVTELTAALGAMQPIDPLADDAEADDAEADEETSDAAGSEDEESEQYRASAIALTDDGVLGLFSAAEGTVRSYDIDAGTFGDELPVPAEALEAETLQFALVADEWVLLDADAGQLWRAGAEDSVEVTIDATAKLQASGDGAGPTGDGVLIADTTGLLQVTGDGTAERIVQTEGTPAQPVTLGAAQYAAWLSQAGGTLWNSTAADPIPLEVDDEAGDLGEPALSFRTNGDRAVLAETGTGLLWTVPDGAAIPISQWNITDPPKEDRGNVVVEEVTEQVAPTAVDDEFGVRAGEQAPLSVLLNDYDANRRDVLTIVPESLGDAPLPEEFGTVQILSDAQTLTVQPEPDATGSATFTYRITDGTLVSDPATVTLTVMDDDVNTAPAWCPVEGCQREWSVPDITPGGTLVHPVLESWVDPEGDPMILTDVETVRADDPVRALVAADGRLAVRHTDANAGASESLLRLTVRDGRGEERTRELQLGISPDATAQFTPTAASATVGETAVLRVLDRVSGGSGSFELVDAAAQGSGIDVRPREGEGTIEVSASRAGSAVVTLTIRDTGTRAEITGLMRVTATESNPDLTLPPLRAFVRPLADSMVEVLDAIPGSDSRALSVRSADVADGDLDANVIEHARVRVSGGTEDGSPGRVGAVDVTIAEGDDTATGRLTVFQVPENAESSAIAVGDSATVRAGSVVDIRVLDNDVAAPGERLILHPEITGSGTKGELAFASGSTLRYLAPEREGTYKLQYTTYGASSPEAGDVGTVTVTVIGKGSNRDPEPRTLTARVGPGEQREVRVPLSGVDPDGDRVRLTGVGASPEASLSASLGSETGTISVRASESADPGVHSIEYSVRDEYGGAAQGRVRVIIADQRADGAPILSSDYVRLVAGSDTPATVLPLDNDIDPEGGTLTLESVEPNAPGGSKNAAYRDLEKRLDLSRIDDGRVRVTAGSELGTASYRYTAKSSASSSTSDGLILVQTSERVGAQAPTVADSMLSVRDRADLPTTGVDVVTDKVRWSAGDASSLKLSLWGGNNGDYRVQGNRIVGEYNPEGDLVVFRLSGVDTAGNDVASYGFLVIPSLDELKLTLKRGLSPISVDEGETERVSAATLLDLGRGDVLEVRQARFPTSREQAVCEANGDALSYSAGKQAPWSDTCMMDVRIEGQRTWTTLPVPIRIVPQEPVVDLAPVTRTIAPGQSETIDLMDMVRWESEREGSGLRFTVSGGGANFDVQQNGTSVTATAHADATPRAQEAVTVTATGAGESSAQLTLRVGEAARDLPRGGSVALSCTVGNSCTATVVGVSGEYDPYAGQPGGGLSLASVSGGRCAFGEIARANDTDVRVTWPDARGPGGRCTIGFTVSDAQGRTGEGSIELDAKGVPRAPASLTWTDFGAQSVTFTVELGSAQSAHPAVSGVELSGPGRGSCTARGSASYQCTVTGLSNGEKGTFTARAVNSVGASSGTSAVTAWAYRAPEAPTVSVAQESTPRNTDPSRGTVRVRVEGDSDVASYSVRVDDREISTISGSSGRTGEVQVGAGARTFTAVPSSRYEVPPIASSSPRGGVGSRDFTVAGAPKIGSVSFSAEGDGTSGTVQTSGVDANGAPEVTLSYGLNPPRERCVQEDPQFNGLTSWRQYTPIACAQSDFGRTQVNGSAVRPNPKLPAPNGDQYEVATNPSNGSDGSKQYLLRNPTPVSPSSDLEESATVQYSTGSTLVLNPEGNGPLRARQCLDSAPDVCSDWVDLSPTTAPTSVLVQPTGTCLAADDSDNSADTVRVSSAARPHATVVRGGNAGTVVVSFGGPFSALSDATLNVCVAED